MRVFSITIVFASFLSYVFGSGIVALTLYEFRNPQALTYDMSCCDGFQIPGCPSDSCDNHFEICLSDVGNYNCTHGLNGITAKDNQNTATFEGSEGRTLFKFNTWPGTMHLLINVTDVDSDGSQLVDTFAYNYSTTHVGYNGEEKTTVKLEIAGNRPIAATRLYMGISVFCDQHYYGKDCSIKCIAQSGCEGHYTCDQNGSKLCSSGWTGENCAEQIPGAEADCSIYQGQNEFVPSKWVGTYHCPSQANVSTVLNVTKSETRIEVAGDFLFNGTSYPMKGTYASTVDFLTVQTSRQDLIGKLSSIELDLTVHKHVVMKGTMVVTGETTQTCEITLTRTQVFFGGCSYRGTCIRFGQNKEQYYCCCKEGYSGTNCETPVKEYITRSIQEPQVTTRLSSTSNLKTTPTVQHSTSTSVLSASSLVTAATKSSKTYQTVPQTSSTTSSTASIPRTSLSVSSIAHTAATNSTSTPNESTTVKPTAAIKPTIESTITVADSSGTTSHSSVESTMSTARSTDKMTTTQTNAQTTRTIASTGNPITSTAPATPKTSTIMSSKSTILSSATLPSISTTTSSPNTFTARQNSHTSTTISYNNPRNYSDATEYPGIHSTVTSSSKLTTTKQNNNHTLTPYFLLNNFSEITTKPTQFSTTRSTILSTGRSSVETTASVTKMATTEAREQHNATPSGSKDRPKYSLYRILLIEILGQE